MIPIIWETWKQLQNKAKNLTKPRYAFPHKPHFSPEYCERCIELSEWLEKIKPPAHFLNQPTYPQLDVARETEEE